MYKFQLIEVFEVKFNWNKHNKLFLASPLGKKKKFNLIDYPGLGFEPKTAEPI